MSRPDLVPLAEQERASLLELVRDLTEEQWRTPSLCAGWSVRDVVVHTVAYDALSPLGLVGAFVRGGLRVDRVNALVVRPYADATPAEVVDLVARHQRPRGLTAGFRGGIALTDGTIHQQDVRRPLGLPREVPADRLRHVLDFALWAPTLPARRHARGLRLAAPDLDWAAGDGPEVTGPGEALLMAVAGRADALDELSGAGLDTLRARVGPRP